MQNQSVYAPSVGGEVYNNNEQIKYVEVPIIQEVIKEVPRVEVIEVEKRVPVVNYQYIDKVVEVPEIHYQDKVVEVPQIHEVIKHVPKIQVVEVPREVIRHVPKITTRVIEKIVEVPGEVIEVEKKYQVENKIIVPVFVKIEVPTVVSQKLVPTIYESEVETMEVTCNEYVPKVMEVDIFVPKPVSRQLVADQITEHHELVHVQAAQWNSLVLNVNAHIKEEAELTEFLISSNGMVPTIQGPGTTLVAPNCDIEELLAGLSIEQRQRIWVTAEEQIRAKAAVHALPRQPAAHPQYPPRYAQTDRYGPQMQTGFRSQSPVRYSQGPAGYPHPPPNYNHPSSYPTPYPTSAAPHPANHYGYY